MRKDPNIVVKLSAGCCTVTSAEDGHGIRCWIVDRCVKNPRGWRTAGRAELGPGRSAIDAVSVAKHPNIVGARRQDSCPPAKHNGSRISGIVDYGLTESGCRNGAAWE